MNICPLQSMPKTGRHDWQKIGWKKKIFFQTHNDCDCFHISGVSQPLFRLCHNIRFNVQSTVIRQHFNVPPMSSVATKNCRHKKNTIAVAKQIANFHRLNGEHSANVTDMITLICEQQHRTSIDNTSIRFIIQCLIVYLRLVFGCWHIDALLLFLIPNAYTRCVRLFFRFFPIHSLHCMHFTRCI